MTDGVIEGFRVVRFAAPPGREPSTWAQPVFITVGGDKYVPDESDVQIDCASRLDLCHAACCRLRVPLSRQDIAEDVAQWDDRQPFLNRQRGDGYCVHCDERTHGCNIYGQRPGLCRSFDCRHDRRIWLDFERRIPNPCLAGLPTPAPGTRPAQL